jgi:hypothetical protein
MIISSSPKNKQLLGENNKALNKRVLSTITLTNSILIIDLDYYSVLVDNKLKYSSSFGQKWASLAAGRNNLIALQAIDAIMEPVLKLKRLTTISKVVLLSKPYQELSSTGKELYKLFSSVVSNYIISSQPDFVSTAYSLAVKDKKQYLILSDKVDFWAICSKKSNIHMCVVGKNNSIKLYSDKFGLEYLSSLIRTNKLVNKLRLSKLKYVNLQYLFLLLLYTKFKHVKPNEDFDLSDQTFLGSKGKGLQLLSDSHREISYIFLTKQSMIDIFLTSSATHFILNLSQLLKITPFDIKLMGAFANYYAAHAIKQINVRMIPSNQTYYKLVEKSKLYCFQPLQATPKIIKKALPKQPSQVDIKDLETSMAVDAILKGLSW